MSAIAMMTPSSLGMRRLGITAVTGLVAFALAVAAVAAVQTRTGLSPGAASSAPAPGPVRDLRSNSWAVTVHGGDIVVTGSAVPATGRTDDVVASLSVSGARDEHGTVTALVVLTNPTTHTITLHDGHIRLEVERDGKPVMSTFVDAQDLAAGQTFQSTVTLPLDADGTYSWHARARYSELTVPSG